MKKVAWILSVVLCVSLLIVCFAGCAPKGDEANSFVALDINPSVEMVVDSNDKVVSVYGSNEDGQVLLYGMVEDLVGKDVEYVVAQITREAAELNYLFDGKAVHVSVSSGRGEFVADKLTGKIETAVSEQAAEAGITVVTDGELPYSLQRRLEEFKAKYPDDEVIQNLGFAQFRLAVSASETGQVTLEAAVKLDTKQLMAMLTAASENIAEFATRTYEQAKAAASQVYDQLAAKTLDSIYAAYYTLHALEHPTTVYYGVMYEMYSWSAHGIGAIADVVKYMQTVSETPLTEEQIAVVVQALNLSEEEVENIRNADGEVTVRSIEAYANKLFENSEAGELVAQHKEALTQALHEIEAQLTVEVAAFAEEYADEIQLVATSAQQFATLAESLLPPVVTENAKGFINEMKETAQQLKDLADKYRNEGFSAAPLYEAEALLTERANAMLENIKADLTEEQLAEVEEIRASAEATLASAKETLENALATAEAEARAYLESLKEQRQSQASAQ